MTKFAHPFLGKHEYDVLMGAYVSRARFGIERHLPPLGRRRATERVVAKGFLPLIAFGDPEPWLVVRMTDENLAAYNAALEAAAQREAGASK